MRVLKLLVQRSRPPLRKQGRRQPWNQAVPADRVSMGPGCREPTATAPCLAGNTDCDYIILTGMKSRTMGADCSNARDRDARCWMPLFLYLVEI